MNAAEQNQALINDIQDAQREIEQLRRRNEILGAKVEVFDSMICLLHTAPASRPMGASPDVVHALELQKARLQSGTQQ